MPLTRKQKSIIIAAIIEPIITQSNNQTLHWQRTLLYSLIMKMKIRELFRELNGLPVHRHVVFGLTF